LFQFHEKFFPLLIFQQIPQDYHQFVFHENFQEVVFETMNAG